MIIISPWSQKLRNGKNNPKNYPYWKELIYLIDEPIVQIGIGDEEKLVDDCRFNLNMEELKKLVFECRTWIGVDSFFQHFCWDLGKPGIVIWGQSDPNIFGHPENINLLKDRFFLREKQFWLWEQAEYNKDAFVSPDVVLKHLKAFRINT